MLFTIAFTFCWAYTGILAAPSQVPRSTAPAVVLDQGIFIGATTDRTNTVHKFLGIPFAQAPVGDLRYRLPVSILPYNASTHTVTSFGPACFQQKITLPLVTGLPADVANAIVNSIYGQVFPGAEDCLTINVWKPAGATSSSRLPVLAWIFGGGFELGGMSRPQNHNAAAQFLTSTGIARNGWRRLAPSLYDGGAIVRRSIGMGQPIVFVSMNYRVSGIGFLASKEVKAAGVGNLGLHDQREALRWIQKYIPAFGGDPTKVMIQGESAGAMSAALHMVTNGGNTEGLFRAAFMQSGGPIPVGDITKGQKYYDQVVTDTGCASASDTLACLRMVPWDKLTASINKTPSFFSYQSLALAWVPRVDGVFLTQPPYDLVASGSVADVPFVTGNCDDEGTLFSLGSLNVTTDDELVAYIKQVYIPDGTPADLDAVTSAYPSDPEQGSPYNTGFLNALTPEYKRIASMQGDLVFQGPRRYFLQNQASKQKAWSYLYRRGKALPFLGTFHGTDLLNMFGTGELRDYAIAFANSLDPNGSGLSPSWPVWNSGKPTSLAMNDGLIPRTLVADTYREAAIDLLNKLAKKYPI